MGTHDLYYLDGFNNPIFQKPSRDSNKGGGLAIYVNSERFGEDTVKLLENLSYSDSPENGEFLFVEIDTGTKNKNIILGNFYRSPSYKTEPFINKLNDIYSNLKKDTNKNIIFLGDANIDMIRYDTNVEAQNYFNVMSQHGFTPVISRPTRITDHSATLIDHIFTNTISNFQKSGIITDHFADHLGVYMKISFRVPVNKVNKGSYNYTEFNQTNKNVFQNLIQTADWQEVYQSTDAENKYNNFLRIYEKCYDTAFPKVNKTSRNRRKSGKPWISNWLQIACDRKNALYGIFIKYPTNKNKEKYIKYKKWVEKRIYHAKRKYYSNLITNNNNNAKQQ